MADKSSIEWTDATWNPVRGCTRVSEGCRNCYAEIMAARFSKPAAEGRPAQWGHGFADFLRDAAGKIVDHRWTGRVELIEDQLALPLSWRDPRRIFANSTSDLFHEALPDEALDRIFAVMALAPQHTFQVLTKRPERMRAYLAERHSHNEIELAAEGFRPGTGSFAPKHVLPWPLPNVWLGVSVEDQATADERIPLLLQTPAALRWISAEPLLGPIDFNALSAFDPAWNLNALTGLRENPFGAIVSRHTGTKLDWVVAGGESGHGARPMHPGWARSLRDQCKAAGVPFLFKQWGEWAPNETGHAITGMPVPGSHNRFVCADLGGGVLMNRVGKKESGRLLDGVLHDAYPPDRSRPPEIG